MMMTFDDLSLRAASPEDADALAAFAAAAFEHTYGAQNDPDDTLAYLTEAFGAQQQHNEFGRSGSAHLLGRMRRPAGGLRTNPPQQPAAGVCERSDADRAEAFLRIARMARAAGRRNA